MVGTIAQSTNGRQKRVHWLVKVLIGYCILTWIYGIRLVFCYIKSPVRLRVTSALIIFIGSPLWILLFYLGKLIPKRR